MSDLFETLVTERQNESTRHIDRLDTRQIIELIHHEDRKVSDALQKVIPHICEAVELIVGAIEKGGRLLYFGAGTSGRLGVLDASECPPTYGTDPGMVRGMIAGGSKALTESIEGAEDIEQSGAEDVDLLQVNKHDVVVGIAASGRTPYVLGAMKRAAALGCKVIGVTNNRDTEMSRLADVTIEAVVGPEVILGSTRMKAGTAQKMILNMLTTTAMIRLGKVYGNLMVDLQPSNEKLVFRSKRIIKIATDASDLIINRAFEEAGGHVKTAITMILTETDREQAIELLALTGGFVRKAVELAKR
ncbi:MAG: N-acetylmuramic acid 6-phosphate etherase [Cohnella sp.]|nr:N-acetylmuramic acid 6-phosphate etherase [Cohnella sp.]